MSDDLPLGIAKIRRIINDMLALSTKPINGCYTAYPHPDLEKERVVQDLANESAEEKPGA